MTGCGIQRIYSPVIFFKPYPFDVRTLCNFFFCQFFFCFFAGYIGIIFKCFLLIDRNITLQNLILTVFCSLIFQFLSNSFFIQPHHINQRFYGWFYIFFFCVDYFAVQNNFIYFLTGRQYYPVSVCDISTFERNHTAVVLLLRLT